MRLVKQQDRSPSFNSLLLHCIAGYVEQEDIHSPQLNVLESLRFSAAARLLLDANTMKTTVDSSSSNGSTDGISNKQKKKATEQFVQQV